MFEVNFYDDAGRIFLNLSNTLEIQEIFGKLDTSNPSTLLMDLMTNHLTKTLQGVDYYLKESKNNNLHTNNPSFIVNYKPRV
ncbi:hypothetical protein ACFSJW_07085 [Flavobacterium artemisiae]|uniref:DUF2442 domain-containing protein n=1 Tax=Flavobacterium artemisiae TaxID=2126556 RepID=A0ABW4HCG2_9FLAO